ncbi:hypothetical protein CLV63_1559 [Murinocardiopsis flavida]|uniref:Uncharacterized protein n=1 Tax=Murinocardiopsis flavida TaxID=645275 RepID=A0A2P8C683_9ACTN|nr:hypothetical protein [Murinocardiopsis flavida]PSK80461.1 hypothetical protein CLV63_1559 [Murinocardiopsis flavida]
MTACAVLECDQAPTAVLTYTAGARDYRYPLCAADAQTGAVWVRTRLGIEPTTAPLTPAPVRARDGMQQPSLFEGGGIG